ncbi:terpenoid synthase [Chiua virens]|nr:terpenoid synthase [Chiua virens]
MAFLVQSSGGAASSSTNLPPKKDLLQNKVATDIKEADDWIANFQAFGSKAQDASDRDRELISYSRSAGLFSLSDGKQRAGCDLMHVLFVLDEVSDRSSPPEVRKQKDTVMDALFNPHTPRPKGEWIGGEIVRQFWELTIQNATAISQKRFIQSMDEYLEEVVQESINKREHRVLDIKDYIDARRRTSASKPVFCIIELGLDIPDEVMSHPTIQEMVDAAVDLVAVNNDIVSYNLEQRRGDDLHNLITCVMHEHRTDVNGAMLWVEDFLLGVQERFHAAKAALPQWEEPLNSQVNAYYDGLGQWVRGSDDWSHESERYFGNKGHEIKENKWMSLLPKQHTTDIGPVHVDSSLL